MYLLFQGGNHPEPPWQRQYTFCCDPIVSFKITTLLKYFFPKPHVSFFFPPRLQSSNSSIQMMKYQFLFSSLLYHHKVLLMTPSVPRQTVSTAHTKQSLIFSHPSTCS